jgi:hypothetical protein
LPDSMVLRSLRKGSAEVPAGFTLAIVNYYD